MKQAKHYVLKKIFSIKILLKSATSALMIFRDCERTTKIANRGKGGDEKCNVFYFKTKIIQKV